MVQISLLPGNLLTLKLSLPPGVFFPLSELKKFSEAITGFLKTCQLTASVQGGVVREPL